MENKRSKNVFDEFVENDRDDRFVLNDLDSFDEIDENDKIRILFPQNQDYVLCDFNIV